MARRILCPEHGKVKPTPPEDLARGLDCRWRRGILTCSVCCDTCAIDLPAGSEAVCFTQPSNSIGNWEAGYILEGFAVFTPTGTFVIFDAQRFTIAVKVDDSMRPFLQEVNRTLSKEYAAQIAGLDLVCEEDRTIGQTEEHLLYYAHPGTFVFVPSGRLELRRHEFKGDGQVCPECGLGPHAEIHA